jgi:hypothetical protein
MEGFRGKIWYWKSKTNIGEWKKKILAMVQRLGGLGMVRGVAGDWIGEIFSKKFGSSGTIKF